jgi:pimeloyl-ACP methyl ester carboxylesterase
VPDSAAVALLVLLPGLDGTGKLFRGFINSIGAALEPRIVSYPPDQPLGYEELESLIGAALPSQRPFFLLGESFSGPLAIRIAARSPPGLRGVVLCATFARNPYPWLRWAAPLAARVPVKSLPRWVRALLMCGSRSPRSAPPAAQRAIAGVDKAVIRRRIGALLTVDVSEELRRIRCPTLVISAARDRVIPRSAGRWIKENLPDARQVEIDGPHLLLQACPQVCANAVLQFIRDSSPAR